MSRDRLLVTRLVAVAGLYLVGLAATSVVAGSATGIFGAWHFQRVSPMGLAANLATMPIVSVIVMPFAVFGMLLMPFDLDGPMFWVMGQGLAWMTNAAAWFSARTPIDAIGAIPPVAVILLSFALVPLALATTNAWRAMSLPFLVLGICTLWLRDLPLVLVDEDARLVAVRLTGDQMAANRQRPNRFVTEDWRRAMMANGNVKPVEVESDSELFNQTGAFACGEGLCAVKSGDLVIAHTQDMPTGERACGKATVLILADPTGANPCPHSETSVVTAKTLALRGAMQIDQAGKITFAIGEVLRPWHDHRRFSRSARGMAPYKPKPRPSTSQPATNSGRQDAPSETDAFTQEAAPSDQ